jgi:inhibitor of cysteine peptidase
VALITGPVFAVLIGACSSAPGGTAVAKAPAANATVKRPPMTIQLGENSDGTEVQAHVGDTLEIRLPENATAGYRWAIEHADPTLLAEQSSDANYPNSTPGSGGIAILRVHAVSPGTGVFKLKYWRSFEGEAGIIRRFSVTVNIS